MFTEKIVADWELAITGLIILLAFIHVIADVFEVFKKKSKSPLWKYIKERQLSLIMTIGAASSIVCIMGKLEMNDVDERTRKIEGLVENIDNKLKLVDEFKTIRNQCDPILDSLCDTRINEEIAFFEMAINEKKIDISDLDQFTVAYAKTFHLFPKSHIFATSLPDSNYFWSAEGEKMKPLEYEISSFIKNGGHMTRIFYIDDNDRKKERTQRVFNRQLELGVEVLTVEKSRFDVNLFVLYEGENFGWKIKTDPAKKILNNCFTRNLEELSEYNKILKKLVFYADKVKYQKANKGDVGKKIP